MAAPSSPELPSAPNAHACAAAGHTFVLLATEMRRVGSEGPVMLIQKPNNTLNQTQTLHMLRHEGHYVKASTQPPESAWRE